MTCDGLTGQLLSIRRRLRRHVLVSSLMALCPGPSPLSPAVRRHRPLPHHASMPPYTQAVEFSFTSAPHSRSQTSLILTPEAAFWRKRRAEGCNFEPFAPCCSACGKIPTMSERGPTARSRLILPIQYLRGIAALMVVWHHAAMPGGRNGLQLVPWAFGTSGVDVFFVISGFIMVVTTSGSSTGPLQFWHRRIVRVVPLYWLLTLLDGGHCVGARRACSRRCKVAPTTLLRRALLFVPHFSQSFPAFVWPLLVPGVDLNFEMFFYAVFGLSLVLPERGRLLPLVVLFLVLTGIGLAFGPFTSAAFAGLHPSDAARVRRGHVDRRVVADGPLAPPARRLAGPHRRRGRVAGIARSGVARLLDPDRRCRPDRDRRPRCPFGRLAQPRAASAWRLFVFAVPDAHLHARRSAGGLVQADSRARQPARHDRLHGRRTGRLCGGCLVCLPLDRNAVAALAQPRGGVPVAPVAARSEARG